MAPIITDLSHLANPLGTPLQLETSASQLDGVPKDIEDSIRFGTTAFLQAAGILLRLPQDIIAQAIVMLQRSVVGADGVSLLEYNASNAAAAALYLAAKPSSETRSPRQVLVVFAYLESIRPDYSKVATDLGVASTFHLSQGQYELSRDRLYTLESQMLRVLGFQTHVALPYSLCINYLQTMDVVQSSDGPLLAKRAFAHLNTALLSPQVLYLTHQPSALATAAIYLAARDVNVNLPDVEWWEVFDVDREELGFLVVAFLSVEGFAAAEKEKWAAMKVPLRVDDLRNALATARQEVI